MDKVKERDSGIELLKILSIFMIVIFHITQTLTTKDLFLNLGYKEGFYAMAPTKDITIYFLMMIRYLGAFGNLIFVISTSYFLSKIDTTNTKKIIKIIGNTLIISLLYLLCFYLLKQPLTSLDIRESIFPLTYQSNWFITTYLLFIMTIPFLNIIINKVNHKQLFHITITMFLIYFGIAFMKVSYDLCSIIVFITIYFMVNYIKKYNESYWSNKTRAILAIILGILLLFLLQLGTNILGFKWSLFQANPLYWQVNNNPILLIMAIFTFYLFKQMNFKNKIINSISSLTLFIYLIHENVLFRTYIRVKIWHYLYTHIGYQYIFIEILIYAVVLLLISIVLSFIYKYTVDKILHKLIEKFYPIISKKYNKIEDDHLKNHHS